MYTITHTESKKVVWESYSFQGTIEAIAHFVGTPIDHAQEMLYDAQYVGDHCIVLEGYTVEL